MATGLYASSDSFLSFPTALRLALIHSNAPELERFRIPPTATITIPVTAA
jgi:hypothetical protein